MNQEMRNKAAEAFNTGAEVAKKIGLATYETVKKRFAETKEKRVNNASGSSDSNGNGSSGNDNLVDKKYYLYKNRWLFDAWVLSNVVITYYCYDMFDVMSRSPVFRDAQWRIFVGWLIALFLCRLVYELITASYDKAIYLRQLRDEIQRHNAWAELKCCNGKADFDSDGKERESNSSSNC